MTINVNELRYGSIVGCKISNDHGTYHVLAIPEWKKEAQRPIVINRCPQETVAIDKLKPIKVDESWLKKLGFVKKDFDMSGCNVWQRGIFRVLKSIAHPEEDYYGVCVDGVSPPTWVIATFEYLHTLQNIWFALTAEEIINTDEA
jgi:hypothetical protein